MTDKAGTPLGQVLVEAVADGRAVAGVHHPARKVRARDEIGITDVAQRTPVRIGDADPRQRLGNILRAASASVARTRQAVDQVGMERVDLQSDDMHGLAGPGDGNFHTRHVAHAQRLGGVARLGLAAELVVIGQCPECHAAGTGAGGDIAGR